jgi:hypothetical protein
MRRRNAASRASVSQAAWVTEGKRPSKASAIGLSTSLNSVAAPGKAISRLARNSLANATRVATSDLRARLTTRKAVVSGRIRNQRDQPVPSVRSASAST